MHSSSTTIPDMYMLGKQRYRLRHAGSSIFMGLINHERFVIAKSVGCGRIFTKNIIQSQPAKKPKRWRLGWRTNYGVMALW